MSCVSMIVSSPFVFFILLRPPRFTRTATLVPYTTLFLSAGQCVQLDQNLSQLHDVESPSSFHFDGDNCRGIEVLSVLEAERVVEVDDIALDRKSTRLNSSQ